MKKIRILQVIGSLNMGGAETFLLNVLRNIDTNRYQFYFLCYGDLHFDYDKEVKELGGKIIRVRKPKHYFDFGLIKLIEDAIEDNKIDIVHAHTYFNSMYAVLAARRVGIRDIIIHSHNTNPAYTKNFFKRFYYSISKYIINRYGTIFLACGKDAGEALFWRKNKFEVIDNGIIMKNFKYSTKTRFDKRKELKLSDGTLALLNVGRFEKQKNHEYLVEVFSDFCKKYSNTKLFLIGEGSLKEQIVKKVRDYGLEDSVEFLGKRNDIGELLSAMDVFVFPSIYEGLPVALVEAQANGIPIVASSGIDKNVDFTGLIKFLPVGTTNKEEWGKVIGKMANKRLKKNKNLQKEKYDVKNTVSKLRQIYERVDDNNNNYRITLFVGRLFGGGAERVVCNLANYLVRNKYNVDIITMSDERKSYKLDKNINRICLLNSDERSNGIRNFYIRRRRLKQYIKSNQDVSCYIAMLPFTIFMLMRLKRFTKSKMIISERNYPGSYNMLEKGMMRYSAKKCDGLVVQTKEIAEWYKKIENKIIIPNAINDDIKLPVHKKIDKKFVSVGRLEKQKNYSMLIEAFSAFSKMHPDYSLEIYGYGGQMDKIRKQIDRAGLNGKVKLMGYVDDISKCIASASCYIITSNYEGIPNSLIEAMCIGLPCIATDCDGGGARCLIRNGKNGYLVAKNDVDRLAARMNKIVEDKDNTKSISKNAKLLKDKLDSEKIYMHWKNYVSTITRDRRDLR